METTDAQESRAAATTAGAEKKRIAIACGGTGGHLFPGLAVAEQLRQRGHELLIIISEKEIDTIAMRDRTEFRSAKLPSLGYPGLSLQLIPFGLKLFSGYLSCRKLFRQFKPDAVLGMGGFTSTVPLFCARQRKVPRFIHESNAIAGKANRLNARFASAVLLGFEACQKSFSGHQTIVCGTPVREALLTKPARTEAAQTFGLDPADGPIVLVMGGSQGAQGINLALADAAPNLKESGLQVIHLAGSADVQALKQAYAAAGIPAHVADFCNRMEMAYGAADVVISRSGASSLTETAYYGLPAILIPYPHAADDHQRLNAEIFAAAGAAALLSQPEATPTRLTEVLMPMLKDSSLRERMSSAARSLSTENSAVLIANMIEEAIQKDE